MDLGSTDQPTIESAGEVPALEQPIDDGPAIEPSPAPTRARRSRTRAKAQQVEAVDAVGDVPPLSADDAAPAKPKRTRRAKAKPAEEAQPAETSEAPAGQSAQDIAAEAGTEAPEDQDSGEPAATPVPDFGFGLLFQAPEPVVAPRRRSRRATSAVTSPPPAQEDADDEDATPDTEAEPEAGDADESEESVGGRRRRRRGGRGRRSRTTSTEPGEESTDEPEESEPADGEESDDAPTSRRRTRRRRRGSSSSTSEDAPGMTTRVRESRARDEVTGVRGSTRLEAKKQRRREGREAGRRRQTITEAEFLARRESVERVMVVREREGRTQIAVLEDGVLVEHYVSRETATTVTGNIYLGRVQNVLPSMEAAFVDIGRGRNAVLYAGEVNWDAAGMESGSAKRIENALESGQSVLVQVTKDPIGHKGARLTSQVSLPGRFLVYVPDSQMTGISRKLPDTERTRLKRILRDVVPDTAGVIVRTAAEGASEEDLRADVERLTRTWEQIQAKAQAATSGKKTKSGPVLLHGEPDMTVRVIRDVFNEDFARLVVAGDTAWSQVSDYVASVAPDLAERLSHWTSEQDVFAEHRIDEQIAKAMDRKVWLPSGGSLVIDRTEAMTVIDVNTGKFVGSGGNLEETVTRNNIEAAEEIVRQLRLRDIGGIIVIDFIDMVLESNRDLVVRRLLECLGRDRTKHQVAEVTSLGLVQMTRKRVGSGLIEVFGQACEHCNGRGYLIHAEPIERTAAEQAETPSGGRGGNAPSRRRGRAVEVASVPTPPTNGGPTPAQIAAAAHAAALKASGSVTEEGATPPADLPEVQEGVVVAAAGAEVLEVPEPPADPEVPVEPDTPSSAPTSSSRGARRRRGRVVAPAGPPGSHEGASAE